MASGTAVSRDSILTRTQFHSLQPLDLFPLYWLHSQAPISIPLRFIFSEQERSLWMGPLRIPMCIQSTDSRKVTALRYPQGPRFPSSCPTALGFWLISLWSFHGPRGLLEIQQSHVCSRDRKNRSTVSSLLRNLLTIPHKTILLARTFPFGCIQLYGRLRNIISVLIGSMSGLNWQNFILTIVGRKGSVDVGWATRVPVPVAIARCWWGEELQVSSNVGRQCCVGSQSSSPVKWVFQKELWNSGLEVLDR